MNASYIVASVTAELRRSYVLPNWDDHRDRTEGKTSATSVLHFASTRSRNVDEWDEIARMAQDLLSLATFSPCAVLRQTLIPDDAKIASDPTARSEVHVYTKQLVTGAPNEPAIPARRTERGRTLRMPLRISVVAFRSSAVSMGFRCATSLHR